MRRFLSRPASDTSLADQVRLFGEDLERQGGGEGRPHHKPVLVHTLRHSVATPLLLNGVDILQIQEYLGHANVETTMVYTHVVNEFRTPARSPLDLFTRQQA